jgi:hypothetical protein
LPGVRATRVGWLEGREVVDLRFDPERLSWSELLRSAREAGCAERVHTASVEGLARAKELLGDRARVLETEPSPASQSDETYYLRRSPLRFLPLTPLQVVRLNSVLGRGADPGGVLSPRQLLLSQRIQARLEREPKAFDGLERPSTIAGLAAYADALERILAER